MRDIREPENPYRNDYGPWDLWGYVHEVGNLQAEGVTNIWVDLPGWETLHMSVDPEGWLVPSLEAYRQELAAMKHGEDAAPGKSGCTGSFRARGKPDQRMMLDLKEAKLRIEARYIPPVPEWLAKAPPESAMLLPGDEVVTYGEVGNADLVWERGSDFRSFYRYDIDGNLLNRTEPGQTWWNLYFDLDGELEKYPDAGIIASQAGYVGIIYYPDNDETKPPTVVWFNYKGEREAPGSSGHVDGTRFLELYMQELPKLYEYQQEAVPAGT